MSRSPLPRAGALLAGAAALLPLAMAQAASPSSAPSQFAPPAHRLVLSRTLRSPLADGREIVSRRTYALSIVADGDGFRIDGEEIDCTVDAPQSLAGLAQLERTRRDAGPFPLHLDRDGMLVAEPRPLPSDALHRASDLAGRTLDQALPDPGVRLALLDLVASLTAGQQTAWPQDLFHPAAAHRLDRRTIVLPDGTEGQVEVEVVSLPGGDESTRVQRTVTTELGKSRRTTREEWVLAPARAR